MQAGVAIGLVVGNSENEIFNMADDDNGMQVDNTVEMVSSNDSLRSCIRQRTIRRGAAGVGRAQEAISVGPYLIHSPAPYHG